VKAIRRRRTGSAYVVGDGSDTRPLAHDFHEQYPRAGQRSEIGQEHGAEPPVQAAADLSGQGDAGQQHEERGPEAEKAS
jgi:hypothetical protein